MSNLPTQIRDQFQALSPPFLQGGYAEKFGYVMGLMSDLLLEKAFQAMTIRVPGAGDPSQIPYLANDRLLVQGPAETNAAFILRLQTAFAAWKRAGSSVAVLEQLQAYASNLQPSVAASLPEMTIVGGPSPIFNLSTWDTLYNGDAQGKAPAHAVSITWNWDGQALPWRAWLILQMHQVPTGLGGSTAAIVGTQPGSLVGGQVVNGVWVPATSGTAVNNPWLSVANLSGLTGVNLGQWLTISGSTHPGNNGTFPITQIVSATQCVIANPNGQVDSPFALSWSVGYYPWIGPGPVLGAPGCVWGQGEQVIPPVDFGSLQGGVWAPANKVTAATSAPTISYGLNCSTQVIQSIRQIVKRWKSANAYYPNIIVAFDGGTGAPGSAFSPYSTQGNGNPDGTFGATGENVAGVWVPTRRVSSYFDCYCNGTGQYVQCSVENVT